LIEKYNTTLGEYAQAVKELKGDVKSLEVTVETESSLGASSDNK
jgi:tellurite resistance-related uncharacterized protein